LLASLGFKLIRECLDEKTAVNSAVDDSPDIVVLDDSVRGADSITVAKSILKRLQIPIIIIGGVSSAETAKQAALSGIAAFLSKPLRNIDFVSAVEISLSWLHERQVLQQKIEHLSNTIETRKIVDRAKGMLMEKEHLSEHEAYRRLQKTAMNRQLAIKAVASEIILGQI